MTDLTIPAEIGGSIDPETAAHAWRKSGSGPWVVPGTDLSDNISVLDSSGVNGFQIASTSGLDVTFDGGEAYPGGWMCRDRQTTITLPDDSTTTVYVGFSVTYTLADGEAPADHDNIIIGPSGDFGDSDPKIPLYDITTASGAVDSTDRLASDIQPFAYDTASDHSDIEGSVRTGGNLEVPGKVDAAGPLYGSSGEVSGNWTVQGADVIVDNGWLEVAADENDVLRLSDGSGGSNTNPFTTTIADRGYRIYSHDYGSSGGSVFEVDNSTGSMYNQGDGVPRVTEDWDEGTSGRLVKETPNGDTIEYIEET